MNSRPHRGRLVAVSAGVLALAVIAPLVGAGHGAADAPPAVDALGDAAAGSVTAGRGTALQQSATLPPPTGDSGEWQTGSVPGCNPGQTMRGVNTGGKKIVTFTFDDGPDPRNTHAIMNEFERRGLTATFFMIGRNIREFPAAGREVVARGFAVGSHSVTHQYKPPIIASEVKPNNDIIESVLGVRTPYFRAPGLNEGPQIDAALRNAGMCGFSTDVDLHDYVSPRRPASQLCASFSAGLRPGTIVLLHDGGSHAPTVAAVPCMLDIALSRGYKVVGLEEFLNSGTPYTGPRPPNVPSPD